MQIKTDIDGGEELVQFLVKLGRIKKKAKFRLRAAAFILMRRIVKEMPRLTGRAAASWGKWTPSFILENPDASKDDAIWEVQDDGTTFIQGTNVPYVRILNEGSSTQAPRGFIDKAADDAQRELMKSVNEMIDKELG